MLVHMRQQEPIIPVVVRMEDCAKLNRKLHNFHLFIYFVNSFLSLQATCWNQIDPVLGDCQFANLFFYCKYKHLLSVTNTAYQRPC